MKRTIILAIITALCPLSMMAQLELNSTFNKKDTVLSVSLKNNSDKNNMGLYCEYYHSGDDGSYLEWYFLDSKGSIIDKSKYGFIINNIPKRFFLIKPKQKLEFKFNFPLLRNNQNVKKIKKLRVRLWLKYAFENDKLYENETIKEFSLE